jgi:ATP-dependent protease ClpP protease subunit
MGRRTAARAALAVAQEPIVSAFLAGRAARRTRRADQASDGLRRADQASDGLRVVNAAGDGSAPAEIYIYEEISDWWGICAQDVVDALKTITADAVDVHINSPGGDVFDALAIYQVLLSHPATINVYIDGLAASAASYIAQAGDTVRIGSAAMVMIHDAWGWAVGNAADMAATGALLDKISANLANVYATRAGGTADEWRARMLVNNGDGTWYTGQEAVDAGLADEVIDAGKRKRCAGAECEGCPACSPDDGAPADRAKTKTAASIPAELLEDVQPDPYAVAVANLAAGFAAEFAAEASAPAAVPAPQPASPDPTGPADEPPTADTWDELTAGLTQPDHAFARLTRGLLTP